MSLVQMQFVPEQIAPVLRACAPPRRFLVAASGGLDSSVLLHAVARLRDTLAPCTLRVVHVEHGLHPDAPAWSSHVRSQAEALGCDCAVRRIDVRPLRGESLEAVARTARYAALAEELAPGEVLLTAHHADDQLETVLLALLRGSGVEGLSAMPECAPFARGWHLRPLLHVTRAALAEYARAQALAFRDDPSNLDPRFARNYLRSEVVPRLIARWPAATATAARSAALCAEAAGVIREIATVDLAACARDGRLAVSALATLGEARARNVVRAWIRAAGLPLPSQRKLAQVLNAAVRARVDACPRVTWPGAEVRRHGDLLHAMQSAPRPPASCIPFTLERTLDLEALGSVQLLPAQGAGIGEHALTAGALSIAFRRGGERLRLMPGGRRRTLKNLLREHGVVPWMRDCIPLLYAADRLVAVADLWIDADAAARADARAFQLRWDHHPPLR
jgi:tRNA(Ile)-lysidine synthase